MPLLGWTLTRSTPSRPIVRPRATQAAETEPGVLERLNHLESTVDRLQLESSERQLAVLTAVEKVMHQLRAREAKREREAAALPTPELPNDGQFHFAPLGPASAPPSSSALAQRFRRW